MTNEQLIIRLVKELYDLKKKLEFIRSKAIEIQANNDYQHMVKSYAIDIINEIDTGEVYED